MSRETLQESLSAVMDNEADELELRRLLSASESAEVRATWSRYQLARAAMHKDLLDPRLDIAAAVSAALADEAVPLPVAEKQSGGSWRTLGRLAVAASVTVAVLAGVRLYNQDEVSGAQMAQQPVQPSLVTPQLQGSAMLAGFSSEPEQVNTAAPAAQAESGWHERRLPAYLRQHAQQAAMSSSESALPYARAASLEGQ